MQPSLDVIKWLFEKVADISAANESGETTLHLAAQFNRKDVIELILKQQNVDVNLPDLNGNTPLHWVFSSWGLSSTEFYEIQFDVVKILLEAGADANMKNSNGEGALHLAAATDLCNPSVIKLLLDYGANHVNELNTDGKTPLELAVNNRKSSGAVVKILIDAGAVIINEHLPFSKANNLFHSALEIYQDQLRNQQRSEEVKKIVILLLKYSLMERPTSYHLLQLDEEIIRILKIFEEKCHQELNKPCPKFLKLAQLFRYCRLFKDLPRHEIVTMLFKNCCPIYKDVLEGLMKRKDLEKGFKSYPIYVEKTPEELIVLDYDITCNVIQYLTEKDLLSLLLAVYHT